MQLRSLLVVMCLLCGSAVRAADAPQVPLWPNGAPGSEGKTAPEVFTNTDGVVRVSSIHNPSVTVHLPPKDIATGAAVIVLPGGGHKYLSIENEGNVFGNWLAEHGVAAFVLKYRLAKDEGSTYKVEKESLADSLRAVRLVRSRAKEWNVDPARIGILGFSAGGELASMVCNHFDAGHADDADAVEHESSRPDFQALIYGGTAKEAERPKDSPPTFICVAYDDKPKLKSANEEFAKLHDAGINVEMHIFAEGGHGFGMRNRPMPITGWPNRLYDWLGDRGFLKPAAATAAVTTVPAATAAK